MERESNTDNALEIYYIRYLQEIRGVKDSTVKHYQDALKHISNFLIQNGKLKSSIFEIQDLDTLEVLKGFLYTNPDFLALDKRGHQMYSAGFNNYYRFASGDEFIKLDRKIKLLDIAVPAGKQQAVVNKGWRRSSIIKNQVIESANYHCEVALDHLTFTAKNTNHPYMEGHHILPMKIQDKFSSSLDVYANIVCVCPICHRLLHYGVESEKKIVVDKIYAERADRLASSGIKIGKEEFEKLVI